MNSTLSGGSQAEIQAGDPTQDDRGVWVRVRVWYQFGSWLAGMATATALYTSLQSITFADFFNFMKKNYRLPAILDRYYIAMQDLGDRERQEDCYGTWHHPALPSKLPLTEQGDEKWQFLLALADGMGGHQGGDTASRLAVEAAITHWAAELTGNNTERLQALVPEVNEFVCKMALGEQGLLDMGSTLVVALIDGAQLHWVSVGDSPLWLYRQGTLRRLNADHSMRPLIDEMVIHGEITQKEADQEFNRHILRSAIGYQMLSLIDLCVEPEPLEAGDLILLASDGIETLDEREIAQILAMQTDKPLREQAQMLLDTVLRYQQSCQDNTTLQLYQHPDLITPK